MRELVSTYTLPVVTVGADGEAVGSASLDRANGMLLGIYFDYHASAPATTDVTVTMNRPPLTLLTIANAVTDGYKAVRVLAVGVDGADIAGQYELFPVDGKLTISVAQSNALSPAVTAYVHILNE